LIDTAEFYNNEAGVGSGLKKSGKKREDIFIVSKWWPSNEGAKGALRTLDTCLQGLENRIDELIISLMFSLFI